MFDTGDGVRVSWEGTRFHGLEGIVESIEYGCAPEIVYMVRHTNGIKGMFTESQLMKIA